MDEREAQARRGRHTSGWRRWWTAVGCWAAGCLGLLAGIGSMERAVEDAAVLERAGDFAGADALLSRAEQGPEASAGLRATLAFERERLRRIRRDFRLTRDEVFAALEAAVRDVTRREFEAWIRDGLFDIRRVDGEERFFVSSVSNLFFRHPDLEPRRLKPRPAAGALAQAHWENAKAIRSAAAASGRPYVLPKRFRVQMKVAVVPRSVPAGEWVSAWLPVPRQLPYQGNFDLVRASSAVVALDPETQPARAVFLRQAAGPDGGTTFEIAYDYTSQGVWFDLEPSRSRPVDPEDPGLAPFLGEAPHVRFTPEMRALAREVAGEETNAVRRARLFHHWISNQVRYSYAPEYSTFRNLAETCRATRRGDCGQVALLFMTLCRLSGIPARWQSGWAIFPGDETIHDWCEIRLEPWGWVPVDPYMGMYAMQYATSLTPEQRTDLRDFYLGGLTQYRMSANGDHQQPLHPPKVSLRSDPVDFQRGEVEAGGRNLYFDRFDYDLRWEERPVR